MCMFVCMEFVYTCGYQPFSQPVVTTNSEECTAHQQVMQKCSRPYWEQDEPLSLSVCTATPVRKHIFGAHFGTLNLSVLLARLMRRWVCKLRMTYS